MHETYINQRQNIKIKTVTKGKINKIGKIGRKNKVDRINKIGRKNKINRKK